MEIVTRKIKTCHADQFYELSSTNINIVKTNVDETDKVVLALLIPIRRSQY